MEYGICTLASAPCRAEGSDKAEMVTQLLFGEIYTVLERTEKWLKIKNQTDEYVAWICVQQHHEITESEFNEQSINDFPLCGDILSTISNEETKEKTLISYGAKLPFHHQKRFKIRDTFYQFSGAKASMNFEDVLIYAKSMLNAPYLWGGKTILGIDCSGLTQVIFSLCGISLPRDAYQQAELGIDVHFVETIEEGDLVFFDNAEGRITHVGIALGDGTIIHASGKVRIDKLDHQGIYNEKLKKYTHQLKIIKRFN